ncbi:MAG TPA: hypothetical protein ENG95_04215 [Nitrospirae bacterium]|nr:chromosomal replication initiation protein [bacterium BMS3Abin10]GBE39848.1 chromosomal replication initiation protein [bacterium BMS3Bbin08]HDO25830.1 hypothetical protein [Nitrospirota bacterium]
MARQLRIEFEGAFYHITSRGNLRGALFFEEKDREKFIEILGRTKNRYGYLLHAYALMGNHYHLLIETPKANISQIMQNINTSYTVYINKKYQRSGHLFQGRFKGIIVDKDEYLLALSRYIHLNPVKAGIVQKPEDNKWTSYKLYINKAGSNGFVDTTDTLSYFSEKASQSKQAYRAFVEAGTEQDNNPLREAEAGLILGGESFKEKIMSLLDIVKADEELPQLKRLRGYVAIEKVIEEYCRYYGESMEKLRRKGKGKKGRQIAIYLSKILSGKTNKEVGEYFGIKGPAVSGVIKTVEGRMNSEKHLKKGIDTLKEKMINE